MFVLVNRHAMMRDLWLLLLLFYQVNSKQLSPVILVNGDGGTQMEAKKVPLDTFPYCPGYKTYRTIWIQVELLLPLLEECLTEIFRLVYNNQTHTTHPPSGVNVRIPNFGNTGTVEWLIDSKLLHISKLDYYHTLVTNMVKWGYQRNKSVRAAPFDFRKAPNELGDYYRNLTRLIEETYSQNNNTRVIIIGHSLGNLAILYYLNDMAQQWKDKYIRSFITMAGPWGGSVKAMKMIASGDDIDIITLSSLNARIVQRSMPSSAFLMPSPLFWNKSEVLLQTIQKMYTVDNYREFFSDLGFNDGYMMREDTADLVDPRKPPNVEVHCLYGSGLNTTGRYVYGNGKWPDKQPDSVWEDGDTTVSLRSLEGCLPWHRLQKRPFYAKSFQGVDHMGILKNSDVIAHLKSILVEE